MEQLLEILKTGGPMAVAAILGGGLVVIWKKLQALRKFYEGDPGDEKTPETKGRLREDRDAAQKREDEVVKKYDTRLTDQRKHYEGLIEKQKTEYVDQIKAEREENKALYRELVEEIKALGGEEV